MMILSSPLPSLLDRLPSKEKKLTPSVIILCQIHCISHRRFWDRGKKGGKSGRLSTIKHKRETTKTMSASAKSRPDPLSLEAIFYHLTAKGLSVESRAYHLVALNTVAFNRAVKQRIADRPDVIRAIALFLMQRAPAATECRWELMSLIGELCRREARENLEGGQRASTFNEAAVRCAETFVLCPWFRTSLVDVSNEVGDKDVSIAAKDILAALPEVKEGDNGEKKVAWTKEQKEKCVDLMFLDATTHYAHLIPLVSRSSPLCCASCNKTTEPTVAAAGTPSNEGTPFQSSYLRCSACKAVYYCSQACQVAHWKTAHKVPCQAYKSRIAELDQKLGTGKAATMNVNVPPPLEPSLFFETRRFLYDHRDQSLESVNYEKFFMDYATHNVSS